MLNFFTKRLNRKNKKGFTLVELIVVIAIVAVLAAVGIPAVAGYVNKSQQSSAESNAKLIATQAGILISAAEAAGKYNEINGETISATSYTEGSNFVKHIAQKAGVSLTGNVKVKVTLEEIKDETNKVVGFQVKEVEYTAKNGKTVGKYPIAS